MHTLPIEIGLIIRKNELVALLALYRLFSADAFVFLARKSDVLNLLSFPNFNALLHGKEAFFQIKSTCYSCTGRASRE